MSKKQTAPAGDLAERLKWAMSRAGYESFAELARDLNLSTSAVHQWSNGLTESIKPAYLFKAARALRVEAEWLGAGEGPRTRLERSAPDVDAEICRLVDALPGSARAPLLELLKALHREGK